MILQEFMAKFLPDCNKKYIRDCQENLLYGTPPNFIMKYFPEAIQNFADKICEKQRINCRRQFQQDSANWAFAKGILNSEQPKIEEL